MCKKFLIILFLILILFCIFYPNRLQQNYSSNRVIQLENFDWSQIDPSSTCNPTKCIRGGLVNGSCVCDPGWQGTSCDQKICQNGGFVNGSCVCDPGWNGPLCDQQGTPTPTPSVCQNGKLVNNSCVCNPEWQGVTCDQSTSPSTNEYKSTPQFNWTGKSFNLDGDWDFYTGEDRFGPRLGKKDDGGNDVICGEPTHGNVCYGQWNDLISTENNQLKISVALNPESNDSNSYNKTKKRSIRIGTKNKFNGGLFVCDVQHIPEGKGVWPAIWLTGPDWPNEGEIDIIEGIGGSSINSTTLHTKLGCYQDIPKIINRDCNAGDKQKATQGCGVQGPNNSFGKAFNDNQGGVYVCEWIYDGTIKVWLFNRDEFAKVNQTSPSTWKNPYVTFNPCKGFFNNLTFIINTTLCGDWAGATFTGIPKDPTSISIGKCNNYVGANALPDAYWIINYIKVYQK